MCDDSVLAWIGYDSQKSTPKRGFMQKAQFYKEGKDSDKYKVL